VNGEHINLEGSIWKVLRQREGELLRGRWGTTTHGSENRCGEIYPLISTAAEQTTRRRRMEVLKLIGNKKKGDESPVRRNDETFPGIIVVFPNPQAETSEKRRRLAV